MPIYEFQCPKGCPNFDHIYKIAERNTPTDCPSCGSRAERLVVPTRAPGLSLFQSGWWHDITDRPLYIETPQQLRDACDRHGAYSLYLENGPWRTSPGPDEVTKVRDSED